MSYSKLSDSDLKEVYKLYNPDSDFNGSMGLAIAEEVEKRAGGLEKLSSWLNPRELSSHEENLIRYIKLADQYGLNPNKSSEEGIVKKQELLHSIGVHRLYSKKSPGQKKAFTCPVEHAPVGQVCSVFNQYYVQGMKLREEIDND